MTVKKSRKLVSVIGKFIVAPFRLTANSSPGFASHCTGCAKSLHTYIVSQQTVLQCASVKLILSDLSVPHDILDYY